MRIFLTGGSGLLGNTILRRLAAERPKWPLVALTRHALDPKIFRGIDADPVLADLGDSANYADIDKAIAKCDAVIHSAALIHIGLTRLDESMRVNRDGTAAIVEACIAHRKPLVHVGTVDTLAVGTRRKLADETTPRDFAGGKATCSYVLSKIAGVDAVLAGVERGLRAAIVHPGFMLGPWDWKPSSGRMIEEVAKTWRPVAPAGGCSVCDSRDVAGGAVAALDGLMAGRIESGRQYILGGENWTYFELWREIAERAGASKPLMPAGPAQLWIGRQAAKWMRRWSAEEGNFNSASLALSSQFHWYDSSRARAELGYRSRDARESLDVAVNWVLGGMSSTADSAKFLTI